MDYLSSLAIEELSAREVPDLAITVADGIVPILQRVGARVTREHDPDEGDDPTGMGLRQARCARNLVARHAQTELPQVAVRWPRGSLELEADHCRIYMYAGQGEVAAPHLRGSITKDALLSEFEQLSLLGVEPLDGPPAILIAYRSTLKARGLTRAVVGVPSGVDCWAWSVDIYTSMEGEAGGDVPPMPDPYDPTGPAPVLQMRSDARSGDLDGR